MGNILDSTQMTINGKSVRALSINNKVAWESSEEFSGYPCIAEALRNKPLRNYTVKGRTLVVNQYWTNDSRIGTWAQPRSYYSYNLHDNGCRVVCLEDTANATNGLSFGTYKHKVEAVVGHIYLLLCKVIENNCNYVWVFQDMCANVTLSISAKAVGTFSVIKKCTSATANAALCFAHRTADILKDDVFDVINPQAIDLTLMFGAGNEPTTALAYAQARGYSSIEEVPYEEYNAGEVQGVGVPVKWNQLCSTVHYVKENTYDITQYFLVSSHKLRAGHKYYITWEGDNVEMLGYRSASSSVVDRKAYPHFCTAPADGDDGYIQVGIPSGKTADIYVNSFDLTEMGIADSVSTVEEFKAYLVSIGAMASVEDDIPYFDYDAGSTKYVAKIKAESRNLWNPDTITVGYINSNGSISPPDYANQTSDYIPVKAGEKYTFSIHLRTETTISNWIGFHYYAADKSKVGIRTTAIGVTSTTFVVPEGATYLRIGARHLNNGAYIPMLERGDSVSSYSPYHAPEEIAVLMDTPLHGIGTALDRLDYKSSLKENKYKTVDLGDFTYYPYGTEYEGVFYIIVADYKKWNGILCSKYSLSNQAISSMPDKSMTVGSGGTTTVWFKNTSLEQTAEALKAAMTGSTLVYCPDSDPTLSEVLAPALGCFKGGARYEVEGTVKPSEIIVTR